MATFVVATCYVRIKSREFVGCRVHVCGNEVAYENRAEIEVCAEVQSQRDTDLPLLERTVCHIADFRSSKVNKLMINSGNLELEISEVIPHWKKTMAILKNLRIREIGMPLYRQNVILELSYTRIKF